MTDNPDRKHTAELTIEELIAQTMRDLEIPVTPLETATGQDQYRVLQRLSEYNIGRLCNYDLDFIRAFNNKMNAILEEQNVAYELIDKAKEEGRYIRTYEETVQ